MKKTKNILLASLMLLCLTGAFAQSAKKKPVYSGIYFTYDDYKADKLTYIIDCDTDRHGIMRHDPLNKPSFEIKYKGVRHTLEMKNLFAYRDCYNHVYRFFDDKVYQLDEEGPIYIYFQEEGQENGGDSKVVKSFFFSATADGEIQPLTVEKLKAAYPKNAKFHGLLDTNFKKELPVEYDKSLKSYKVNQLYQSSLNQK